MYGMNGSASGQAAPARGRMHRVIIAAEHAGHSVGRRRVVDERAPVADGPVVAHGADHGHARGARRPRRRRAPSARAARGRCPRRRSPAMARSARGRARPQPFVLEVVADERHARRGQRDRADAEPVVRAAVARPATRRGPARSTTSWPRARSPRASSYVLQPLPPQTGGNASVAMRIRIIGSGAASAWRIASSSVRQCAAQLNSRRRRAARAAAPRRRRSSSWSAAYDQRVRQAAGAPARRRAALVLVARESARGAGCAGATTGRPAAMYSNTFSGDQ